MDSYARAFASFVSSTDEKEVLATALLAEIRGHGARSVCDIGAGPGGLAQRLAAETEYYIAVESNSEHAASLRSLGLSVVERKWPMPVSRQFGAIVLSHVLDQRQDADAMIGAAADAVEVGGVILVVLHAIAGSEWERLMLDLDMAESLNADLGCAVERELSERHLRVHRRVLRTTVRARTEEQLVEALSFVAGAGGAAATRRFASRLAESGLCNERYWALDGYEFPFEHLLVAGLQS